MNFKPTNAGPETAVCDNDTAPSTVAVGELRWCLGGLIIRVGHVSPSCFRLEAGRPGEFFNRESLVRIQPGCAPRGVKVTALEMTPENGPKRASGHWSKAVDVTHRGCVTAGETALIAMESHRPVRTLASVANRTEAITPLSARTSQRASASQRGDSREQYRQILSAWRNGSLAAFRARSRNGCRFESCRAHNILQPVAQRLELSAYNRRVTGSNPVWLNFPPPMVLRETRGRVYLGSPLETGGGIGFAQRSAGFVKGLLKQDSREAMGSLNRGVGELFTPSRMLRREILRADVSTPHGSRDGVLIL